MALTYDEVVLIITWTIMVLLVIICTIILCLMIRMLRRWNKDNKKLNQKGNMLRRLKKDIKKKEQKGNTSEEDSDTNGDTNPEQHCIQTSTPYRPLMLGEANGVTDMEDLCGLPTQRGEHSEYQKTSQ